MSEGSIEEHAIVKARHKRNGIMRQKLHPHGGIEEMLQPIVIGSADFGNPVFIIAEPGMGKTYLTSKLVKHCNDNGYRTYRRSFADCDGETACRRLTRFCRDLVRKLPEDKRTLVVIDGIAPSDEAQAAKEGRSINRLVQSGVSVVVCLMPESEQLAEQLPGATCLRADDLQFRSVGDDDFFSRLTGGIPALVVALRSDVAMGEEVSCNAPRYLAAVADLVKRTLRPMLPDEEFRIRLAMLLLGSGSIEDVALVAGRCDVEQLAWLKRDVPLLGIDSSDKGFSCCPLRYDEVLEHCVGALQEAAAAERELVIRACGVLASRGEFRRSATVCRTCSCREDMARICTAWGVSYVLAGEAAMVSEALDAARATNAPLDVRSQLAEAAIKSVTGTSIELNERLERLESIRLAASSELRLAQGVNILCACRDMLRCPHNATQVLSCEPDDLVGLACLDHLRIARLLASGRFDEAYARLSNEVVMREPQSIPELCLCDDLALAIAFGGGSPDDKERGLIDRATAFAGHIGVKPVQIYHAGILTISRALTSSEYDMAAVEGTAVKAERQGDAFLQAVCLVACAAVDVRMRALSRAHVRANRAAEIARTLGEEYVASAAELVDAIALELLGEIGAFTNYCRHEGRPEDLALVGYVTARALGELGEHDGDAVIPAGTPCPRDALWVIRLIAFDCPEIWETMRVLVPPSWSEALRAQRARLLTETRGMLAAADEATDDEAAPPSLRAGEQTEILPTRPSRQKLHVSLLGGFSLEYGDRRLGESILDRRRAHDLMILLAVVPGHRLRRFRAIEVLWPHDDYYRCLRKLYEATGEVRKRLGGVCGANVILSDRTQGSIGLDLSVVSCDIDEFEHAARNAIAEDGNDFKVLEHARRMVRIYSSGPDEHLSALGHMVAERCRELRTLYVDGAVAAGEAALRLGKAKLAVRYAEDAYRLGGLREDAMILLVRALKASGRRHEIPELYRRYARELVDKRGMPPSSSLRRAVEIALGEMPHLSLT